MLGKVKRRCEGFSRLHTKAMHTLCEKALLIRLGKVIQVFSNRSLPIQISNAFSQRVCIALVCSLEKPSQRRLTFPNILSFSMWVGLQRHTALKRFAVIQIFAQWYLISHPPWKLLEKR